MAFSTRVLRAGRSIYVKQMTKLLVSVPNHSLLLTPVGGGVASASPACGYTVNEGGVIEELIRSLADEYTTNVNCLCSATELLDLLQSLDEEEHPGGGSSYFHSDATNYAFDNGLRQQLITWNQSWPTVVVHICTVDS